MRERRDEERRQFSVACTFPRLTTMSSLRRPPVLAVSLFSSTWTPALFLFLFIYFYTHAPAAVVVSSFASLDASLAFLLFWLFFARLCVRFVYDVPPSLELCVSLASPFRCTPY